MPRAWIRSVLSVALLVGWAAAPASAADPPPEPRDVAAMIETIKADLLALQKPDGSWEEPGWNLATRAAIGGHTALVTWALLQAGVDPHSERILKAAQYLINLDMAGTYNRSLRCMVLASLARIDPQGKYARAMQSDVDFLTKSRLGNGRWTYIPLGLVKSGGNTPDRSGLGDNSNSQFAILALREAAVAGANIPQSFWTDLKAYWQAEQREDGGFTYRGQGTGGGGGSYGSMTGAGTASLFICEDMLRGGQCCVGELPESISLALAWLSENFAADANPKKAGEWWSYWLYSVERVAETSGYRAFGTHDWFWEGTAAIHSRMTARSLNDIPVARLCGPAFALIFLAKGAAPLVLNKLQLGDGWNPNPLDATHMTRYLAAEVFERHLNWMTIQPDAPLAMFHEAPLLLITSKTWPGPADEATPPLRDLLRTFCETGGTVLIDHTCTPDRDFARNLDAFLAQAWPGRRLTPLDPDHLLWRAHFAMADAKIPLLGLGNGCREYVILSGSEGPANDLSCLWHRGLVLKQPAFFQIAANLYMYVTDKSFRAKLEPRSQLPRSPGQSPRTLPVGRLVHRSNPNPCPLALPMLGQMLSARAGLGLDARDAEFDQLRLLGRRVLVISGQGRLEWTGEQIQAVRDYLKAGGMVLGDALMGDNLFAESLRRLAAGALQAAPRPVSETDPLLTGSFAPGKAFDLRQVYYSRALRWRRGVRGPAVLEGVKIANRWAFLISPYDLTNGLTTARPYGMLGYEPDDAARIAGNCMLYADSQSAGPAAAAPD